MRGKRFRLIGFDWFDLCLIVGRAAVRRSGAPHRQPLEQSQVVKECRINDGCHSKLFIGPQLVFENICNVNGSQWRQFVLFAQGRFVVKSSGVDNASGLQLREVTDDTDYVAEAPVAG